MSSLVRVLRARLTTCIATVLAATLLRGAQVPAAAAYDRPGETPGDKATSPFVGHRGHRPATFWVGDSITKLAYIYGVHREHPGYEVSAINGRDVSNLPYYLDDRLDNPSALHRVVIALGTNASSAWTSASLRAAVAKIPAHVVVVFVSTYRDPAIFTTG